MLVIQRPTVEPVGEQEGNRQKFAVSPLEPGFGHTIGNSLRRTLLSAIPGAAITHVRFDTELHEFAPIKKGVTEDATDALLNLQGPRRRRAQRRADPRCGSTKVHRPGAPRHRGRHRAPTPDVEIINLDMSIATLNEKGRLSSTSPSPRAGATSREERNKRHRPDRGDRPSTRCSRRCGGSPLVVEPTRVEMDTNCDRLILDIETDGSITPRGSAGLGRRHPAHAHGPRRRHVR